MAIIPETGQVTIGDIATEWKGPKDLAELSKEYPLSLSGDEEVGIDDFRGAAGSIVATGGTISDLDGYRYHTFTSSGDFTVTYAVAGDMNQLEAEILGGGGCSMSGGNAGAGGGGGGGRTTNTSQAAVRSYTVTVGGGGAPGTSANSGSNGGDSSFNGATAFGGGRGFENPYTTPGNECKAGGCGGGYRLYNGTQVRAPGSQGGDGGMLVTNSNNYGTGGGGAGGNGGDVSTAKCGNGGSGISMFGVVRGGGGGGGTTSGNSGDRGSGGSGGGGNGGYRNPNTGTDTSSQNGTNGYGGGAGAKYNHEASTFTGRSGGSGIVVIRYKIA